MAKTRRLLLAVLSALLLFSQQVAVTHALWHQTHDAVAAAPAHPHEGDHASHLCDFDAMLGQLLAGGAIASPSSLALADVAQAPSFDTRQFAAVDTVQPRSRGPPLVL